LEISFVGKKVNYPKMPMNILRWESDAVRLISNITLSLKAFDVKPPGFLTMSIQDAVPVKLDMF
jgi:hypothetical protein